MSARNSHEELSVQLQGCSGADLLGQGFTASVTILGALGEQQRPFSGGRVKDMGEAQGIFGILEFDLAP